MRWVEEAQRRIVEGAMPDTRSGIAPVAACRRKYPSKTLSGSITPPNSLLFQISSIAQVFSPLTITLFKIWHASIFSLEHYAPTNARFLKLTAARYFSFS